MVSCVEWNERTILTLENQILRGMIDADEFMQMNNEELLRFICDDPDMPKSTEDFMLRQLRDMDGSNNSKNNNNIKNEDNKKNKNFFVALARFLRQLIIMRAERMKELVDTIMKSMASKSSHLTKHLSFYSQQYELFGKNASAVSNEDCLKEPYAYHSKMKHMHDTMEKLSTHLLNFLDKQGNICSKIEAAMKQKTSHFTPSEKQRHNYDPIEGTADKTMDLNQPSTSGCK